MFNTSTSQKPLFEVAQVVTSTMEKITQANLQLASTVTKAYFDACTTCYKLSEENSQQGGSKTGTAK